MTGLTWFIVITFFVVFIQACIYRRWGLSNVEYSRYFNKKEVFEGEFVEMVEKIYNKKILPLPWLRIESKIDANLEFQKQTNLDIKHEQFHKSMFSLMPYTGIIRRHKIKCKKRGLYTLNSAAITCGDLFGVQDISKTYQIDAKLIVYPEILSLDEIPLPAHSLQGDVVVRRWIVDDPFIISGVREYTYGDPLNRVNWKATAKVGRLQVHNNDFSAQPRILIYLNVDISEDMWDAVTDKERIEKGISYAASIANYAISKGIDVGFGSNAHMKGAEAQPIRIEPAGGKQQLLYLLEAMAKLEIERDLTFHTFLEQDIQRGLTGHDILILSCFMSDRLEDQINILRKNGNAVEFMFLDEEGRLEEEYAWAK